MIDETRALVELARGLGPAPLDGVARAELRDSVLLRARAAHRRSARRIASGGLAVAVLLLGGLTGAYLTYDHAQRPKPAAADPASTRATLHPLGAAQYVRMSSEATQMTRLSEGRVLFDVPALVAPERFVVVAGDAEVQTQGAVFEVGVERDRLVQVRVLAGAVDVRPTGRAGQTLHEGQRWAAPDVSTEPADVAAANPSPSAPSRLGPKPRRRAPRRAESPPAPAPAPATVEVADLEAEHERLFNLGWRALRAKDYAAASDALQAALTASPDGELAEDARFWRAVALRRSGDAESATKAFREFLKRYAHSARRAEAELALGWLALERGDAGAARQWFTRALDDPSAQVADSAREGLERLPRAAPSPP